MTKETTPDYGVLVERITEHCANVFDAKQVSILTQAAEAITALKAENERLTLFLQSAIRAGGKLMTPEEGDV